MKDLDLHEHETTENKFTWSNGKASGMIYSIIDRAICNREWFLMHPLCVFEVLSTHISGHAPLRVKVMGENTTITRYKTNF